MRYRFFLAMLCGFSPVFAQNAAPVKAEDLFRLIRAGNTEGLRRAAGSPNVVSSLGETPLHYAATYGSVESVRILLDHGADPNARNRSGATPLISGASVACEILAQGKGEKVIAFKKKRRKNTHRKRGHRQPFTKVKITGITAA